MPLFSDVDLGPSNPYKIPKSGMHVGVVEIPGGYAVPYGIDSTHPAWQATFWFQAQSAVGAFAAGSQKAVEYLGRQLEELSRNPDLQPCYVQLFNGTNLPVATWAQPQDGFYYITSCNIDYSRSLFGFARAQVDLEYVSPGPPRRVGISSYGGALSSNYSGAATNLIGFPFGSTSPGTFNRLGGEGNIPFQIAGVSAPTMNPWPLQLSATISDWFKGGCRVYDAMAVIGTNPVPAAPTFLNTNWVEVKGPDHKFVGDIVLTNGLLLLTLSPSVSSGVTLYLWNTALASVGWQKVGDIVYADNAVNFGTLRQVSFARIGLEEVAVVLQSSTSAGNLALLTIRLQRGAYHVRVDFRPQGQANTSGNCIILSFPAAPKIYYNPSSASDDVVGPTNLSPDATYGYAAAFVNSTSYPFVAGFLYQNQPALQPGGNSNVNLGLGDTSGPALNASRSYGIFAIPYGSVSGGTATDKLQAEAETNVAAPWTNAVDAAASAGHAAKLTSGNVNANNQYQCNTNFSPSAGTYAFFVRVRTGTIGAGVNNEVQVFLQNSTQSTFAIASLTPANVNSTTYVWKLAGTLAFNGTDVAYFGVKAQGAFTTTVDWFVDQVAMAPTSSGAYGFPQDLFQQYLFDRTTKLRLT